MSSKPHLRRAVRADLDPCMGAAQTDVRLGDGRHPDEVISARKEGGERGGEGHVLAHRHADRRGHQLLFGDEHLEVALGVHLGELLSVRGVPYFAVKNDDVGAGADCGQRLPKGQPGGDFGTELVAGQLHLPAGTVSHGPLLRQRPVHSEVTFAAQFDDGPLGHLGRQRPPVPALGVFDLAKPPAFAGAGQDHSGPIGLGRIREGLFDFAEVVAVDRHGPATEPLDAPGVGVDIPAQFGGPTLAEAVHVHDDGQVVQVVIGRLVECLPNGPLSQLAVTAKHPDPERQLVEVAAGHSDPDGIRQSLAKRPSSHVDPRQDRGRVALQA